jgi:hypothetical protein
MRANFVKMLCLAGAALIVASLQSPARPQGSGSSRAAPPRTTRPPTPEEFYQSFWKYLNKPDASYKKWGSLPGKSGLREGPESHGDFLQTYANKTATDKPDILPYGSILVTENYDKDKKLKDITVMYRSKGADAEHGDWYWLKYRPDGSIARTSEKEGKKAIAGKVSSCIECHSKAGGKDLVYSNEPEEKPVEKADEK